MEGADFDDLDLELEFGNVEMLVEDHPVDGGVDVLDPASSMDGGTPEESSDSDNVEQVLDGVGASSSVSSSGGSSSGRGVPHEDDRVVPAPKISFDEKVYVFDVDSRRAPLRDSGAPAVVPPERSEELDERDGVASRGGADQQEHPSPRPEDSIPALATRNNIKEGEEPPFDSPLDMAEEDGAQDVEEELLPRASATTGPAPGPDVVSTKSSGGVPGRDQLRKRMFLHLRFDPCMNPLYRIWHAWMNLDPRTGRAPGALNAEQGAETPVGTPPDNFVYNVFEVDSTPKIVHSNFGPGAAAPSQPPARGAGSYFGKNGSKGGATVEGGGTKTPEGDINKTPQEEHEERKGGAPPAVLPTAVGWIPWCRQETQTPLVARKLLPEQLVGTRWWLPNFAKRYFLDQDGYPSRGDEVLWKVLPGIFFGRSSEQYFSATVGRGCT